jgi:ketosteroid isomerase-like protein
LSDISATSDSQAITQLIRGIYEAFAAGNVGAIESALADDCTVWDVFTPQLIKGRDEREKFHAADQRQKSNRGTLTWRLDAPLIDVWNDTAIARYELQFAYAPPRAVAGSIRITDVLRKRAGRWQIVHHHEGTVPSGVP